MHASVFIHVEYYLALTALKPTSFMFYGEWEQSAIREHVLE